ncbi:MAG: hypothetical protein Q9197_004819 [Variospora fuerteventurae]
MASPVLSLLSTLTSLPHANYAPSALPTLSARQPTTPTIDSGLADNLIPVEGQHGVSKHRLLHHQDDTPSFAVGESYLREVFLVPNDHQLISPFLKIRPSFNDQPTQRVCLHRNQSLPITPQPSESEVTPTTDPSRSRSSTVTPTLARPTLVSYNTLPHQASFSLQVQQCPLPIYLARPATESQAVLQQNEPSSRRITHSCLAKALSSSQQAFSHHSVPLSTRVGTLSTSPASPVQARTGEQKLSNRARRTQKHINIINATFARCVGKPVSDKYKGLAYPVYRGAGNVKYVLATHSDLRIVKILQHRTEADQADIRLTKIKTPSHPRPQTCIAVSMPHRCHEALTRIPPNLVIAMLNGKQWKYQGNLIEYEDNGQSRCKLKFGPHAPIRTKKAEPDGSIYVPNARLPFMIFEVRFTQTKEELMQKVQDWVQGCNRHIKIICAFHIDRDRATGDCHVLMDVIRPIAINTGTTATSYRMQSEYVIRGVEIYPSRSSATFDIDLADVFRKEWGQPPAPEHLTVNIDMFFQSAKQAAARAQEKWAAQAANHPPSSPYDPDQEAPEAPGNSTSGSSEHDSEGDAVEYDPDYVSSSDDDDDPEPRIIRTRSKGF